MVRNRTDGQVVSSAAQIDDALAAGLTANQLIALVAARHAWRVLGRLDPTTITPHLTTALSTTAAESWDAIFTRRARTELATP